MLEDEVRALVNRLLLDVPIMRKQGTPDEFLAVLRDAILFYPVFANWESPIDAWLAEAEDLSRQQNDTATLTDVLIRRAGVNMRRIELDAALAQLDDVERQVSHLTQEQQTWAAVTRARILTRQHSFDDAASILDGVQQPPSQSWTAPLPMIALGELQLESNDTTAAESTLSTVYPLLPVELIEERVQVGQSLGFIAITHVNPPKALKYLDQARQILHGAAVWSEVIQMNLVVGNFRLAEGERAVAEALFEEALALLEHYPQPQFETLIRLSLARLRAAQGRADEAVNAALQTATLYAQQGSVLGYLSMILYIARIYTEDRRYEDAYRTLATGIGIAKHKGWEPVIQTFRAYVNNLREKVVGPRKFDQMVQRMIDQAKGQE